MYHCNESDFWIWICCHDISASFSMHICTFQHSVYICASSKRVCLCLFCCLAFLTLLEVIKLTFNVHFIIRINLRIFQILSHYYFDVSINISNKSLNLYLFKSYFWCYVMPVNIAQWRAGIGRFHSHIIIQKTKKNFSDPIIIFKCMLTFFYNVFLSFFILKAEDVELNPEPPKNPHS